MRKQSANGMTFEQMEEVLSRYEPDVRMEDVPWYNWELRDAIRLRDFFKNLSEPAKERRV